ncbi:DNA-binding MarR family transcriptional regulator [Haloferula luteola]|uniref:DNA-binding MarR family transcriptional regulator n=1 Tax=Haloferula luteola TaxID=595692 RepID=A0A840V5I3_9BACT|nr:MarR family transcriptional regulator [Haloferula luteola]MBB5352286.1 DNA-binding MarR family transcriptional regulator [Haloferula luteola]
MAFHSLERFGRVLQALRGLELSVSAIQVFLVLAKTDRHISALSDLARRVEVSKTLVTHIANRMEALGLGARTEPQGDRRFCSFRLSPKGVELARSMEAYLAGEADTF